jgi:hypothetical protein
VANDLFMVLRSKPPRTNPKGPAQEYNKSRVPGRKKKPFGSVNGIDGEFGFCIACLYLGVFE